MSFLSIIPRVRYKGGVMLCAFLNKRISLAKLTSTNHLVFACEKDWDDSATVGTLIEHLSMSSLSEKEISESNASRPMIDRKGQFSVCESVIEPFSDLPSFESSSEEVDYNHVFDAQSELPISPHPNFRPDLSELNINDALSASTSPDQYLLIHEAEAYQVLRTALSFACTSTPSRYGASHLAFTAPNSDVYQPWGSPLTPAFTAYISNTHSNCLNSIRNVSFSQPRLELRTCLGFAFVTYLSFTPFVNIDWSNKLVPGDIDPTLRLADIRDLKGLHEILRSCEDGTYGEAQFVEIWDAWMVVLKVYLGILVVRDRNRRESRQS